MTGSTLSVQLLGEFRISVDGRQIPSASFENRRASELVKLLALSPGFRLARDQVIELFWPHLDPDAGAAALHKAASHLRAVLEFGDAVTLRSGEVTLGGDHPVTTDVAAFESAAKAALLVAEPEACARASALYDGELLPADRYLEWLEPHRERLAALHLELLRKGHAWQELIDRDPGDEQAHLAMMRTHAGAGQRAAALRQFRQLREHLSRELGIAPSPEAIALFEELSKGPAVHAPLAASRPFIGREIELARGSALLRSVAERRGGTMVVRGEAGIGKTRFCEAILAEAAERGYATLRGTAQLECGGQAFVPFVEAFDRILSNRPDLAEKLTGTARRVISQLATAVTPGDALSEPITRQQVLSASAQLLTLAAKERPVLLFLDDLHAVDESSVQLFNYLSRHVRFDRILLVAAYRRDLNAPLQQLEVGVLAQQGATAIDLGPLSRVECRSIAQNASSVPVGEAAADAFWGAANGNPFIVELLAANAEAVAAPAESSALDEIIQARFSHLDASANQALEQLAVLGEAFTTEEALVFLALPEAQVLDAIDRAVMLQLLEVQDRGFRFRHTLLRDALLRRLPSERQREAHARAADALVRVGASAARIARHLLSAGRSAEVGPWWVQGARDEARVGAFAGALAMLDRAAAQGELDVDALGLRAELLLITGDAGASEAFEQAIRRARGSRRDALRVGQIQARVALGDMGGALKLLGEMTPPTEDNDRLRYLLLKGQLDWLVGQLASAEQSVGEAQALASQAGQPRELAEAVVTRALVGHSSGRFPEMLRDDLLNLERAPEIAGLIHEGHLCGAEIYLYGGRPYGEIQTFAQTLRDEGQRRGARRAVAFGTCLLGEVALLTGEAGAADALLDEATAASLEVGARGAAALSLQRRAESALRSGDPERARFLLALALDQARNSPMHRHLLQRVYGTKVQAAKDPAAALSVIDEAELTIRGPTETCYACMITYLVPASIACANAGVIPKARAFLGMAEQMAKTFWRAGAWFAAVAEARGQVELAEGNRPAAHQNLTEAARLFAQAGQKLDAQRCLEAAKTQAIPVR